MNMMIIPILLYLIGINPMLNLYYLMIYVFLEIGQILIYLE
nr:MAG TPA: hypothetical protein [Caudoviricetes sp.]